MSDEEPKKAVTANKLVISLLLFVGLGFLLTTFVNYSQTTTTQQALERRAAVGDELLELNKKQAQDLKNLMEKLASIENKLDNLEKQGKPIK